MHKAEKEACMPHLKIGIDYDDTITADFGLFVDIFTAIYGRGHTPVIVTARDTVSGGIRAFASAVELSTGSRPEVILTDIKAKEDVAANVDIWIDDWPLGITHELKGATYVPGKKARKEGSLGGEDE
jgi:hypothetical protein